MVFLQAFHRSSNLYGSDLNPQLEVSQDRNYGSEVTRAVVLDLMDGVVSSALELPGRCFNAVREASYVLFEMGIDNAITIGNVAINDRLQFSTNQDSIDADMIEGFKPFNPITNAHAWLTLDSGQVLDPTILPSWWYKEHGKEITLTEAIYLSGPNHDLTVEHSPYLTGFSYHLKVISHPIFLPDDYGCFKDWLEHAYIFKRNIERSRAV